MKKSKKRTTRKLIKHPNLKQKSININANLFLNKWIWISFAASFIVSIILFAVLFTFKNKEAINLNYAVIVVLSLLPFIIYILYWTTITIVFQLIFKSITKDIEKDAVFPIAISYLIHEQEISVKKYIAKGNIKKIKKYKAKASKLLYYMVTILILFILFNFLFVGLTQLNVISISTSWIYLFGLLSNIISLILSAIFGFVVSNIINTPAQFEQKYKKIREQLKNFKVFLNVNDLSKIDYKNLKYRYVDFLPLYFYQALLIPEIKQEQYRQELQNWKYYLNLSSYLNQFSWLLYLHYSINKKEQLKTLRKRKYMNQLAFQIKKVYKLLFYTQNDFLYFNVNFDAKALEAEYNQLLNILIKNKNRFSLKMITASLEKNGLKISQTINEIKDDNIIDERDFDINLYQLNYLEFLFSIIFIKDTDISSKEHFKY